MFSYLNPYLASKLAVAVLAAPAPKITIFDSLGDLLTKSRDAIKAAKTAEAVPN